MKQTNAKAYEIFNKFFKRFRKSGSISTIVQGFKQKNDVHLSFRILNY